MKNILILITAITFLVNCKANKEVITEEPTIINSLPELTIQSDENEEYEVSRYQASNKKINDLIHTKLDVRFDWEKQHLLGTAELTFKPYFYSTNELVLDAKGMDIHSITMDTNINYLNIAGRSLIELKYTYDGMKITIDLGKTYTKKETYKININYTAKPNELEIEGSAAITDAKGLYFINPLGTDPNKMPQIWTQGETESSSCWFPTIDSPNEKTTQEISITVKDKFKTLSNGKLISSIKNEDGTRTDYWKQDLKHAPYLFMMAVGEFDITKDYWTRPDGKKMEVNYYTEPEYTPYAKAIFGKTPKMIQFFSDKLGVEYPWHKYNQIVVRDYVSGAMENTTAVIHGDFLYQTDRELLDSDNESIIAHELFHHWFGDLVTCESWSNLTVNESFANYSQYLWDEFEHGREQADKNAFSEMNGYFMSASQSGYHDLVYFEYLDEMEMFDGHSYNKGGRILHMLRYHIGDEAFFASLKHYLNKMKFKAAEAHDLRLSFEEVTGEDLNWFFNQWYFDKGHPDLEISQSYDASSKKLSVTVKQKQNLKQFPIFKLPVTIDIYTVGKKERKKVTITDKEQTFEFETEKPLLVNFDAEKILLCKKKVEKPKEQWVYQLNNSPLYLDKKEAFAQIQNNTEVASVDAIFKLLSHPYHGFNNMGMSNLEGVNKLHKIALKETLIRLTNNSKSSVRANAYKSLEGYYGKDEGHEELITKGLTDKSYKVMESCLQALANSNPKKAMKFASNLEKEKSNSVKSIIATLYADHGTKDNHDFFIQSISNSSGFSQYGLLSKYSSYLARMEVKELEKSNKVYQSVIEGSTTWWMKMAGYQGMLTTKNRITNRIGELTTDIEVTKDATKKSIIEREISELEAQLREVEAIFNALKIRETDKKVLGYLDNM